MAQKTFNITVLPGDGIGPEVIKQAINVIKEIEKKYEYKFELSEALIGGCAIDAHGVPLPDSTLEQCKKSDAVLLGAVGGAKWDTSRAYKAGSWASCHKSRAGVVCQPEAGYYIQFTEECFTFKT